jgi:hypothetical protein
MVARAASRLEAGRQILGALLPHKIKSLKLAEGLRWICGFISLVACSDERCGEAARGA